MVSFNTKDYNLGRIAAETKLTNFVTDTGYRVYGLRQTDNPLIYISFDDYVFPNSAILQHNLKKFFAQNNIEVQIVSNEEFQYQEIDSIGIGLRRDLRNHIVLSAALVQTIIYSLDGKLKLRNNKVPGLPKFKTLQYFQ